MRRLVPRAVEDIEICIGGSGSGGRVCSKGGPARDQSGWMPVATRKRETML
jgi:hypothetical protein